MRMRNRLRVPEHPAPRPPAMPPYSPRPTRKVEGLIHLQVQVDKLQKFFPGRILANGDGERLTGRTELFIFQGPDFSLTPIIPD